MTTTRFQKFYKVFWNLSEAFTNTIGNLGNKLQVILPIIPLVYFLIGSITFGFNNLIVYVSTYGICMLICVILKFLFNAIRPRDAIDQGNDGINPDLPLDAGVEKYKSFCSGHTMSAVCGGLFFFYMTFGVQPIGLILGIVGYTLGVLTGISRIVKRAHWIRDVLTSIAISLVAFFIAGFFMN